MSEGRAIGVVLGSIALITFALAVSLVYSSLHRRRPGPEAAGAIVRAFRDAATRSSTTVAGIGHLLPAGMPKATALRDVAADGFACTYETQAATCFRSVGGGRATDIWTIWLTFDDASKISASQGERRSARP